MWFKKLLKDKTKHLLELEIMTYKQNMLEYELRQKEWEAKKNESTCMSEKRWKEYQEGQIRFSHDKYLEFFYKKQAVEKVLKDYVNLNYA